MKWRVDVIAVSVVTDIDCDYRWVDVSMLWLSTLWLICVDEMTDFINEMTLLVNKMTVFVDEVTVSDCDGFLVNISKKL